MRSASAAAVLLLAAFVLPARVHGAAAARTHTVIRINGAGYVTRWRKWAVVLPAWSRAFRYAYEVQFDRVRAPGRYRVVLSTGARSPAFPVGSARALYRPLLAHALFFYRAQRDGRHVFHDVLGRRPSHLLDRVARTYRPPTYDVNDVLQGTLHPLGTRVNAEGGWFDAGDYLKFVQTASYTVALMLLAVRDYPRLLSSSAIDFRDEARFGLAWLMKMWDDRHRTLYYQVGIGDGNARIHGDHDLWRLPQHDDHMRAAGGSSWYYVKYRPVFRAGPPGSRLSPNLAGRLAADFGLCAQVFRRNSPSLARRCLRSGRHVFALARTAHVRQLLTTSPHDYYPESTWKDDLQLGATEMARAYGAKGSQGMERRRYLRLAARWAKDYISGPNDGCDSLNLYDVSGLADAELASALPRHDSGLRVGRPALVQDLARLLAAGRRQSRSDPFRFGLAYNSQEDLTPHALGYAVEALLYHRLTGSSRFAGFGLNQLNWALGLNAWGSAFIVGAGSRFPDCMQHQVANLSGSLDGRRPIDWGATVDGPNAVAAF